MAAKLNSAPLLAPGAEIRLSEDPSVRRNGATNGGPPAAPVNAARPTAAGKFIVRGDEKLYVRGVTYGTFRPDPDGHQFPDREVVRRDFAAMVANRINSIRTYTVPPRWLLDCAQEHGLLVMVGLPWEQHIAFAEGAKRRRSIVASVRAGVRECAGHPAVLAYSIGNEIPAPIVRWHGRERIEGFLHRLYDAAKSEDPDGLVTYVNFPSTEYLELPFCDLFCFNVYLEERERLEAYLQRLQVLAGDRPLLLAELGLDSRRAGEEEQARSLAWQVREAFAGGCAGAFAFAWTDEWYRGGFEIEDWDFGLTTRERAEKPALGAVRETFVQLPVRRRLDGPRVSVVVCTHNGAPTLRECLQGLSMLDYPDYEVIVIDDGSTDETPEIAAEYPVQLVSTANNGLSRARNRGLALATGEIVAYIDDDACPDPHWLTYLVEAFERGDHCAVGGPNIPPSDAGVVAECVAAAPGGPIHVLLSDSVAEHIPGCNMAFRREALEAIGGFDAQFTAAGDDVDVCWLLQERGWTIGFSAAAMVWHHRRNTVLGYWRQQRCYGRAEALLERKWPDKYNGPGHVTWAGRLYGNGRSRGPRAPRRERVDYGVWGGGLFQRLYRPSEWTSGVMPLMPEWYLLIALIGVVALALVSRGAPLAGAALAIAPLAVLVGAAALNASRALHQPASRGRFDRLRVGFMTTALHLLQPLARLNGRLAHGLTPWRQADRVPRLRRGPRRWMVWSESWEAPEERLRQLEQELRQRGAAVRRGGAFDRWDLEVRTGGLGGARILSATEEHGSGHQLVRFRAWRRASATAFTCAAAVAAFALATSAIAWPLAILPALGAFEILRRSALQSASAVALTARASELLADPPVQSPEASSEDAWLAALRPQGAEAEN
jgi:GT2 family glycosyltransferase